MTEGGGSSGQGKDPSPWEWVVAALSTLLVLGVLAFTGYEAATSDRVPPLLGARVDSVVAMADGGYLALLTVRNTGQSTAAGVLVEGELRRADGTAERAEATVDFVPGEGSREAGLIFRSDPRRFPLEVRVLGFDRP